MKTLLITLQYSGLLVSSISAVWGLTHELSTKDENSKRHLTKDGRFAIAFILLGFFISLNTGVLKNIADNQDKEAARGEAAQKEQRATLAELARQSQDRAREQQQLEQARRQEERDNALAQAERDNALAATQRELSRQREEDVRERKRRDDAQAIEMAQRQRDLLLVQSQQEGFNKAERSARELDRKRAAEEFNQTQKTLFEIRRNLYPVRDIVAQAQAEFPINFQELKGYSDRLNNRRSSLVAAEGGWDKTSSVTLPQDLHPKPDTERLAWRILDDFGVGLEIYRTPIDPSIYKMKGIRPKPDLEIKTRPVDRKSVLLRIIEDPTRVKVENWELRATDRFDILSYTGRITSVFDLYGAQIFVSIRTDDGRDDNGNDYEIIQQGTLGSYMLLQIGPAQIRLQGLKELSGSTFGRLWVITLNDKSVFSGIDLTALPGLVDDEKR
jgi:hypothetical protein